jgi:hypothetical protein
MIFAAMVKLELLQFREVFIFHCTETETDDEP